MRDLAASCHAYDLQGFLFGFSHPLQVAAAKCQCRCRHTRGQAPEAPAEEHKPDDFCLVSDPSLATPQPERTRGTAREDGENFWLPLLYIAPGKAMPKTISGQILVQITFCLMPDPTTGSGLCDQLWSCTLNSRCNREARMSRRFAPEPGHPYFLTTSFCTYLIYIKKR